MQIIFSWVVEQHSTKPFTFPAMDGTPPGFYLTTFLLLLLFFSLFLCLFNSSNFSKEQGAKLA